MGKYHPISALNAWGHGLDSRHIQHNVEYFFGENFLPYSPLAAGGENSTGEIFFSLQILPGALIFSLSWWQTR